MDAKKIKPGYHHFEAADAVRCDDCRRWAVEGEAIHHSSLCDCGENVTWVGNCFVKDEPAKQDEGEVYSDDVVAERGRLMAAGLSAHEANAQALINAGRHDQIDVKDWSAAMNSDF